MNQETKVHRLLSQLETKGLSGREAEDMIRVRDLPKRISVLRSQGVQIRHELRKDVFGQRYARYWLAEFAPAASVNLRDRQAA